MSLEILEKIEKLSELKDKGILTQEEFENKKRYLLDENNNNEMSFTKKLKERIGYQFLLLFSDY